MFKKILNTALSLCLLLTMLAPVQAATMESCRTQLGKSLDNVVGIRKDMGINGYITQLKALTSTTLPVYSLIARAQQYARDARVEMKGICNAVDRFGSDIKARKESSKYYVAAYDLCECSKFKGNDYPEDDLCVLNDGEVAGSAQLSDNIEILTFCTKRVEDNLDLFLDALKPILLKKALRTSMLPLVNRIRSLNERLVVLLNDYGRVVKNFYTFNIRLGDTITQEWD